MEMTVPVFSYLAYPEQGAKEQLLKDLAALDYCEVTPAENEEILILVTDTPDEEKEKELQKHQLNLLLKHQVKYLSKEVLILELEENI